ncbi:MAG: LPS-assembly protein LptD [Gammaproteobacteria bacterium]|nr:LPS-assembly protein LptD [Gammaproteobacteria bacterium]
MLHSRIFLLAGLVSVLAFKPGFTAEDWSLCRIPSFNFIEFEELAADETLIEALSIVSEDNESIRLTGDVSVTRAEQKISADDILYDKPTASIEANGNVVFTNADYRLQSPRIELDNQNDRGLFEQPRFELQNRHARGQADKIERLDQYRTRFEDLTYSACDPDDRDWHLRASELEFDYESGLGSTWHTTFYLQEVPFLYLPYFQFPIDDRRMSGILAPTIGYDEADGNTVIVPIYWNIAANHDMTITPAFYSKRSLQLNTENRYLFKTQRGQLDLSYLDDEDFDDTRWFKQWQHQSSFAYDVKGDLLLAEVSDEDFFDDFGNVAATYKNTRHLERHVSFVRNGEVWSSELQWQNYQTIDLDTAIEDRPYNRLPSLAIDATPESWIENVNTSAHFEWADFDRDNSVTGRRSNLTTTMSWDASQSWYIFKPELQLAFSDYELEDNPGDNTIERALPTLSVDTGLTFERLTGSRNQWLQTLEPRLYFLHTPFEDQDEIPDFDTSLSSRTYNNLFTNNRFTGADRIGDANQVTFGLASRVFDNDDGSELLNMRLGQIFYFKDRRVSLDGTRDEEPKSDVISELDIWPAQGLKIAARLVYDQDQSELNDKDLSINYANNGIAANFGYYFTDEELEQALASIAYPINERWTVIAKYHRSLLFEKPVENLLGLNYESCCWGLKILAGQTGDEADDFAETDTSIYFEMTFKGLSQAGQDVDAQLRGAIPGYEPSF